MYRYDDYYGYWSSDSDSDGGGDYGSYKPNVGEGGKDTGYSPALPDPPPVNPPPTTSVLVDTTPAVITLNEIDEFNGSAAGYIPAGQFTEARAFPLACVNATKNGVTKLVTVKNQRTNYNYAPMAEEIFRFPYYVPAGANLATLPPPIITWEACMQNKGTGQMTNAFVIQALEAPGNNNDFWTNTTPFNNTLNFSSGERVYTLVTNQMLNFIPGKFNEFKFKILFVDAAHLAPDSEKQMKWMITNLKTSLPTGYQFEFKLQKNWESYFNIRVVKDTDRNSKGTATSVQTLTTTPEPMSNGWTLSNTWTWNEYNIAQGYRHWEIPVSTFKGNKDFDLPITVFPENDDYCSMEPSFKTPGPKAPWNLLSRHESFWYAPTWMRISDYAQNISANPIFYCPRNWRGVVWLKQGRAVNDVL